MKIKCSLATSLWVSLLLSPCALAQSVDSRPRRVGVETIVQQVNLVGAASRAIDTSAYRRDGEPGLDAMVPREGLQLYLEIRSAGFGQLLRAGSALEPVRKLLAGGPTKKMSAELTSFVMTNINLLANARLGLASYGSGTALAMIKAATEADAQQLKESVARLAGSGQARENPAQFQVILKDRVVIAGPSSIVEMIASGNINAVSEDPQFVKARDRFAEDPFFAYVDFSYLPRSLPTGDLANNTAYMAGFMGAVNSMPGAIGIGGSIEGETARLRALTLGGAKTTPSLFSGLFSGAASASESGGPAASSFVPPDTDVFVDIRLDWGKVLEMLESVFTSAAAAPDGAQRGDFLAAIETSLGFSIKNDLIPTLGSEIAISISGLSKQPATTPPRSSVSDRANSPRQPGGVAATQQRVQFTLVLALRDPAKFEKLIGRLISAGRSAPAAVTKTAYRGVTITSGKDLSYAISGGFFITSGNAASIRRALDVQASGVSLASSPEFRSAVGSSHQAMLQAYISSNLANKFVESLAKETPLGSFAPKGAHALSGIGLSMTPDSDGLLIEARMPANVAFMVLGAMASREPAPFGITSGGTLVGPVGVRPSNGQRTPKMTTDDVRKP